MNLLVVVALVIKHELPFNYPSESIEAMILQSPGSEIIVLGYFNVHNSDWLCYSSNITNPAGRDADAFSIVNDLTQVISEPTHILVVQRKFSSQYL